MRRELISNSPVLTAGELVAGLPVDPLLAAVHSRVGSIRFEEGLVLLRADGARQSEFARVNERWRSDRAEPLRSLVVFGKEDMLAYYYATVPQWVDAQGHQPVVKLDVHEEPYAVPLASNVDRFFDTYSHYLEALVAEPDYDELGPAALTFPWKVPEIVARDRSLVELLRDGRFDFLMPKDEETRAWTAQVLDASVRR
ncbi:hypothetical protein F0U60_45425 [Archangium minus]|uniref:Uncharacterized protein n=1 Tax=Archangium minus TaxID=83450 RepID=A0ABY9X5E5_9BACT|nr:hypothetical protein F0U61_45615 [Archangium violaceum]WNG50570.1 hypothetical protein F0U60_45425 [Archangium minus]